MRMIVTGGGTGGHTSPALAIVEELSRRDSHLDVLWVGRKGNVEERICRRESIPFRSVLVKAWPRGNVLFKAWSAMWLSLSLLQSFTHLRRFRPDLVLGVGGYVSVPTVWMAQRLSIPTIIHEQNRRLGMANALLARRSTKVLLSFADTEGSYPRDRAKVVGNPVRTAFTSPLERADARDKLGVDPDVPLVLVTGGSQGARTLNVAMEGVLGKFRKGECEFIWITGPKGVTAARAVAESCDPSVHVHPFIDDMATACAAADLIVSRAGASTAAEIAALGRPALFVPYPFATEGHQEANARAFESHGAAVILMDKDCTADNLAQRIQGLLADPARLAEMGRAAGELAQPAAAETIAQEILEAVFGQAPTVSLRE